MATIRTFGFLMFIHTSLLLRANEPTFIKDRLEYLFLPTYHPNSPFKVEKQRPYIKKAHLKGTPTQKKPLGDLFQLEKQIRKLFFLQVGKSVVPPFAAAFKATKIKPLPANEKLKSPQEKSFNFEIQQVPSPIKVPFNSSIQPSLPQKEEEIPGTTGPKIQKEIIESEVPQTAPEKEGLKNLPLPPEEQEIDPLKPLEPIHPEVTPPKSASDKLPSTPEKLKESTEDLKESTEELQDEMRLKPSKTWVDQEPRLYRMPSTAIKGIKGSRAPYELWIDPYEWEEIEDLNIHAEKSFQSKSKTAFAIIVAQQQHISLQNLNDIVIKNAAVSGFEKVSILQEQKRLVNGQEVLFLHWQASIDGASVDFLSYLYTVDDWVILLHTYTQTHLLKKNQQAMEHFLDGVAPPEKT